MEGHVYEIQSLDDLKAMIAGESYSTIVMRRAERNSGYVFKRPEAVELYRSKGDAQRVWVPEPTELPNIRELLQFAATARGDGDVSSVIPPAVRILPTYALWPIIGAGATGAFFQDIGEVWILCPAVCSDTQSNAWFDATLVHELTHFLQLRSRGWDIKADLAVDLVEREFEAIRAQRDWLRKVGNVSWLTPRTDDEVHDIAHKDYGLQAQRVACTIEEPDFEAPVYKGPRS